MIYTAVVSGQGRAPLMIELNQIEQMTREEKLQVMEALWADLSREEDAVASPDWHAKQLRETEDRLAAGYEQPIEWEAAKKELKKRCE